MCGHVGCIERREMHKGFWWGNPKKRDDLEDIPVDGKIILKLSSRNRIGGCGLDLSV